MSREDFHHILLSYKSPDEEQGFIYVDDHAFKHGLDEDSIRYAWANFIRKQYRGAPDEGQILSVGCDARGRLIQMVAVERSFGVLIYHAMTPPTDKALAELGLIGR